MLRANLSALSKLERRESTVGHRIIFAWQTLLTADKKLAWIKHSGENLVARHLILIAFIYAGGTAMANTIRRKSTFGSATVNHFSPPLPDTAPTAINTVLSFEDALKLHLSLGQVLGHLNGYDRSTTEGKRTAVNLCIYTKGHRIAVVEDKIKKEKPAKAVRAK